MLLLLLLLYIYALVPSLPAIAAAATDQERNRLENGVMRQIQEMSGL